MYNRSFLPPFWQQDQNFHRKDLKTIKNGQTHVDEIVPFQFQQNNFHSFFFFFSQLKITIINNIKIMWIINSNKSNFYLSDHKIKSGTS